MKHLFEKHEHNLKSAKYLIDQHEMYAPSIHCSYYSLLQLIKCKVGSKINNYNTGGGSHEKIIETFKKEFESYFSKKEREFIVDGFYKLKRNRKRSDYDNCQSTPKDANYSLSLSTNCINRIKSKNYEK